MVMVSALFFYALGGLALVWLFLILSWRWPTASGARYQPRPLAEPSRRQRANAPKPFTGLTQKPHCALCERDTIQPKPTPAVPPAPRLLLPLHRRPRVVDTSPHCCPHPRCDYWGWLGLSTLRANGHPRGGPWRQFHGTSCKGDFLETDGTIFHGKQAAVEQIGWVFACLAEGLGIRATARVFEVEPDPVRQWLVEAAEQLRACSASCLCDVHVKQLPLDALQTSS